MDYSTQALVKDALASGVPPDLLVGAVKTKYGWMTGTGRWKNTISGTLPSGNAELTNWQIYPDGTVAFHDPATGGDGSYEVIPAPPPDAILNGAMQAGNGDVFWPDGQGGLNLISADGWKTGVFPGGPNESAYASIPVNQATIQALSEEGKHSGSDVSWSNLRQGLIFVGSALGAAAIAPYLAPEVEAGVTVSDVSLAGTVTEIPTTIETGVTVGDVSLAGSVAEIPSTVTPEFSLSDLQAIETTSRGIALPQTLADLLPNIPQTTLGDLLPESIAGNIPASVANASLASAAESVSLAGVAEKIYPGTGSQIPPVPYNANLSQTNKPSFPEEAFGVSMPVFLISSIVALCGIFFLVRR